MSFNLINQTIGNVVKFKAVTNFVIISVRSAGYTSKWLGYYVRKSIPRPVYEGRKEKYRDDVLQPLETMPSIQQRMKELNAKDPVFNATVDIGLPSTLYNYKITLADRLKWQKEVKNNKDFERKARSNKLRVDLDEVRDAWLKVGGPLQVQNVADHYGIFTTLFHHGYFTPWVPMKIFYKFNEEEVVPICMGNILQSIDVENSPTVYIDSKSDDLWTLVLTNLDGHLLDMNSEYLHWFIGNIKGDDISSGEIICDYLRPFPYRGSGYHRMAFVLYKQEKFIDYGRLKRKSPCFSLKERTFKTFDFYKEHQDILTPAGLSFYQCTWDPTLTDFFHHVLDMKEPNFEYKQPEPYYRPQQQFPHLEPFNLYLDRYRDPKEIKKEVLLKRLANVHPFKEEPPMPKYPCLYKPKGRLWSWQRVDSVKQRMRLGKWRELRPHSVYPQEDNQMVYRRKA